jgi:5'-nucleotidase / UDP-sugar diphosphatase
MAMMAVMASLAVSVGAQYNLRILHVNDHHSYVEEKSWNVKTDTQALLGCDSIKEVRFKYGGYARLNQLLADLTAGTKDIAAPKTAGNVLKLHAGDAMTGTLWYSLFKGVADAQVMGKACFHAMSSGNHEFDDGDQNLAYFIQNLTDATKGCPGGSTKMVAANVVPGASSPLKTPTELLAKSNVFTIEGQKVRSHDNNTHVRVPRQTYLRSCLQKGIGIRVVGIFLKIRPICLQVFLHADP